MTWVASELIRKRRLGIPHSPEEVHFLVEGFSTGSIPDYQISAWLMACFVKPLSKNETLELTRAMKNSGDFFTWENIFSDTQSAPIADKHSTGGVGDKVSVVLAPLAACLGLRVPMMSGRGLGFTGGTVDKLESIPGFKMDLEFSKIKHALERIGLCMIKQSEKICPADKKLYALRDVTGTVENIELISASIVSKKWASGVKNIVYDVKCGPAAFMENPSDANALARSLVDVSKQAGMRARAVVTRMDEPLGSCIGNSLEVRESLWILENSFPTVIHKKLAEPLKNLCLELTAHLLVVCGKFKDMESALNECKKALAEGLAAEKFYQCVNEQAGSQEALKNLPQSPHRIPIQAEKSGFLTKIHSRNLGLIGIEIGVGRQKAEDAVRYDLGFELQVALGDKVETGQTLCYLHLSEPQCEKNLESKIKNCFLIEDNLKSLSPDSLILEVIS